MQNYSSKKIVKTAKNKGFGLIEIVVVVGITVLALSAFLEGSATTVRLLAREKENLQAALIAEEGLNAVRSLRDESWNNISGLNFGTQYYPIIENGKWKLATSSSSPINGLFTRSITFDRAYRDGSDRIAPAGGEDTNTRKATVQVSWNGKTYQLIAYFNNFQSLLSLPAETKQIYYEDAPTDTNFANFPSPNTGSGDPAQSFTVAGSIQATKAELLLRRTTENPSNIYAELRTSPTGTILGTSNILDGTTISSSSAAWVEFRFETSIPLAASTKYYIRLRSNPLSTDAGSGSQGIIQWDYRQSAGSPYGGGDAYTGIGKLSNPADSGTQQTNYDFGFRIYSL